MKGKAPHFVISTKLAWTNQQNQIETIGLFNIHFVLICSINNNFAIKKKIVTPFKLASHNLKKKKKGENYPKSNMRIVIDSARGEEYFTLRLNKDRG